MDPVIQLAKYTRDLLSLPEAQIKLGRDNFDNTDFNETLIVVDTLVTVPQYNSFSYDGNNEIMSYIVNMLGDFTLNFYGLDAEANAQRWIALNTSEAARQLQKALEIQIYNGTSFNNLRWLPGSEYRNRIEVSVKMRYNIVETNDVGRIDEVQLDQFLIDC